MTDSYGDIQYKPFNKSTLEAIKETSARLLAEELSVIRAETYTDAVSYLSQWYQFDYQRRVWRPIQ